MTLPYFLRLVCLCLAAFFLVHLPTGVVVAWLAPRAIRSAEFIPAERAARRLFALRLLPAAVGLFVVAAFCIPSYLWLEPNGVEQAGALCLALAALALAIGGGALLRSTLALRNSWRFLHACSVRGAEAPHAKESICVLPGRAPVLALAGIFRPRIVASEAVLAALTSKQLDAALRHERSHRHSHDNLKRLAMVLVPSGVLPFQRGFVDLENAWARYAEWAADDRATNGDPCRAVALAEALLCVSRLPAAAAPPVLVTTLTAADVDLPLRVERLLHPFQVSSGRTPRTAIWLWCGGALTFLGVLLPGVFRTVHKLLEPLMR